MTIALATASWAGALDDDMAPLVAALHDIGRRAEVVVWDDAAVSWERFELVVVRSTWDYVARRSQFLEWAEHVATVTVLANSPHVLRWSTDKHYLAELAAAGVAVTPTSFIEPGDDGGAITGVIAGRLADGEIVVKPAVSAGSADTNRYGPADHAVALDHAAGLLAQGRSVMVQPYLDAVDVHGETALVHIAGRFSHAIRKAPILAGRTELVEGHFASETISAREPSDAERALADHALSVVPGQAEHLLYARIDLIPGPSGAPLVLEMELAEPSMFLAHAPGSAERFAAAIAARIDR